MAMTNLGTFASMLIAGIIAALSQWLAPETKGISLTDAAATLTH
jgi:MFS transporter, putative metabolite transport protein